VVRKKSEAGKTFETGGGDNQAMKYDVESWLEGNEKNKSSEITV